MGGLLTFRVGNFDTTAEREQFRFLCEQLKTHYEDSNEFCVFAGNYNIGCELDALFIKKDAIISIEFKNYGGNVVANENGEWTCKYTNKRNRIVFSVSDVSEYFRAHRKFMVFAHSDPLRFSSLEPLISGFLILAGRFGFAIYFGRRSDNRM